MSGAFYAGNTLEKKILMKRNEYEKKKKNSLTYISAYNGLSFLYSES